MIGLEWQGAAQDIRSRSRHRHRRGSRSDRHLAGARTRSSAPAARSTSPVRRSSMPLRRCERRYFARGSSLSQAGDRARSSDRDQPSRMPAATLLRSVSTFPKALRTMISGAGGTRRADDRTTRRRRGRRCQTKRMDDRRRQALARPTGSRSRGRITRAPKRGSAAALPAPDAAAPRTVRRLSWRRTGTAESDRSDPPGRARSRRPAVPRRGRRTRRSDR